jgi:adenylate cyclase
VSAGGPERPGPAEFAAAGLYEPGAPGAEGRLALLRWLAEQGFTVEEMQAAHRGRGLTGLAGDRHLRSAGRLTPAEVAERAGLRPDQVEAVLLAAGLPSAGQERRFDDADVPTFDMFRQAMALFGEQPTLRITRVLGTSMARIAEAAVSMFQVNVEANLVDADAGELALAQANLAATRSLDALGTALTGLLRLHVEQTIRRSRAARFEEDPFGSRYLAVGFVDLVGYTPLAHELDRDELARLVEAFEDRANAVVTAHGGRLVKHIGDAAMFVAAGAPDACRIAAELLGWTADASRPLAPHGGIALGPLLARGGDYYGPQVNLAARLAELAVPGEVLLAPAVAEALGPDVRGAPFVVEPAGRRMVRGFPEPIALHALTRRTPPP